MNNKRKKLTFFEDFFYGNIEPQALPLNENPDLKQHFVELCRTELKIKNALDKDTEKLFDEYVDAYNNFDDVLSFLMFKKGFSYGLKMAIEVFNQN